MGKLYTAAGGALMVLWVVGSLIYAGASIWAAALGLDYSLGRGWAIGLIIVSVFFRFPLPLIIGAFLGAMYVWHWHWALALLFAAPGLAFMIPSVLASIFAALPLRRHS